jgi:hypothetical protein
MISFLQLRMLRRGTTYMHEEDFTRVAGVELSKCAVEDVILLFP